jgi:hypothetical protein
MLRPVLEEIRRQDGRRTSPYDNICREKQMLGSCKHPVDVPVAMVLLVRARVDGFACTILVMASLNSLGADFSPYHWRFANKL